MFPDKQENTRSQNNHDGKRGIFKKIRIIKRDLNFHRRLVLFWEFVKETTLFIERNVPFKKLWRRYQTINNKSTVSKT